MVQAAAPLSVNDKDSIEIEARASYEDGKALYEDGMYEEALAAFERAHALLPRPAFLFNIAQCHMQEQRYERAAAYYEKFLEQDPKTPHRAVVLDLIAEARGSTDAPTAPPVPTSTSAPPARSTAPMQPPIVAVAEQTQRIYDEEPVWIWIGVAGGALAAIAGSAVLYQAMNTARDPPTLGVLDRTGT